MRTTIRRAIFVGLVMAGVGWLSGSWWTPKSVSLFPDVISLAIFVLLTAIALRKTSPPFAGWGDVLKTASVFGAVSGAILALSAGLRVMLTWQRPAPAIVVAASWLVILLVTNLVALFACRPERASQPSAV